MQADDDDPERARVDELLAQVARGEAGDAEREELALYAAKDPGLPARIERSAETGQLGAGWLARVEGDRRVQLAETSKVTRAERLVGLALVLSGAAAGFVAPVAGTVGIGLGLAVLVYSFARVRLQTHKDDPYKDIKR